MNDPYWTRSQLVDVCIHCYLVPCQCVQIANRNALVMSWRDRLTAAMIKRYEDEVLMDREWAL
jgi:hypothetical protein